MELNLSMIFAVIFYNQRYFKLKIHCQNTTVEWCN